ncbi:NAD(P) transhydrogenase subunit alpha [Glaciecola sp. HTCC2999]|jgi:H+-translocating NAD(P) transhydrogenase subunit alpha|uniref:NAD(P) transhydrogenase subunit alpha n=1 Tax=Glaciecola sp. HTCC2999 TaxID=455436 RepID=UPI0000E11018|nr:NAD(P) transhydrogenase subunit alpha [Glaciecola sp. HTCC2999]
MKVIAFPCELDSQEARCALLPNNIKSYTLMGYSVLIESGLGFQLNIEDSDYNDAGAVVADSREDLFKRADLILSVRKIPQSELSQVQGKILISFLDAFNEDAYLDALTTYRITSFSMEMIPRSTRCQKMDALSSQASLAGYAMVIQALNNYRSIMPMMMTAAGTIKPAKVFVIGAGVAGLQAIATAKRLGATVTAFDTRTVVADQVRSLGAKFLEIDLGETKQTEQGYAQALSTEQLAIQQAEQAKCICDSDIVITTAQLFGRKPPVLIKDETIAQMKPGAVIVDMAALDGGNVEGTVPGEVIVKHKVTIVGTGNWPNMVAYNASQMYANNLQNLVSEFTDSDEQTFSIDLEDEIQILAVITHNGSVTNQMVQNSLKEA